MTTAPRHQCNDPSSLMADDLVDTSLTEQSVRIRNLIQLTNIEPSRRRIIACFLAQGEYQDVTHAYPELLAQLLVECLPAYVHSRGGQIVCAGRMEGMERWRQ